MIDINTRLPGFLAGLRSFFVSLSSDDFNLPRACPRTFSTSNQSPY